MFQSTIVLQETLMRTFRASRCNENACGAGPVDRTIGLWRAVCDRAFLLTTGLQSHRWLRLPDDTVPQGWRWQKRRGALASVTEPDGVQIFWPRGTAVDVPVVRPRVCTRSRCPVVMVRHPLSAPLSQTRSWALSELEAEIEARLAHRSVRWDWEVLFAARTRLSGVVA